MDIIFFFIRYIPFWAIPIGLVCAEFGYIYWIKDKGVVYKPLVLMGTFCFACVVYYYWMGGPEGSVETFISFLGNAAKYK